MVAGSMYWDSDRKKRKEFEGVLAETKAKEKNEAWIRELEARDEEDREMKRLRGERRRRAEGRPSASVAITDAAGEAVQQGETAKKGVMDQVQGVFSGKK